MSLWTLANLRTKVRERSDMEHSEFVSDTELNGYITQSYAKFYDLITSVFKDDYVNDPVSFTISSGNSYTFQSSENFYKLVGVDFYLGTNWTEVRSFNFNQRNMSAQAITRTAYHPYLKYKLMGSKQLIFIPTDQATGTYRYWGIQKAAQLTADTDEIDGYNGWEEFIVWDSAIKCLIKEESDIRDHLAERQKIENDILVVAKTRDTGESEKITDIYDGDLNYYM